MISLPPLWAVTLAGGLVAGAYGTHTWYQAQRVKAIQEARETERGGVRIANQSDVRYIDRLHANTEAAHARAGRFQVAFNQAADGLRRCSVSPDLLRLLNEREGTAAGPAAKPEPAAPETQAGSDCAAVIATYQWNQDNVIEPNRIQIEELQRFYRGVQERFNR